MSISGPYTATIDQKASMLDIPRIPPQRQERERAINAPGIVLALVASFVAVHVGRSFLSFRAGLEFLILFAFIPARYDNAFLNGATVPGGMWADIWTFFTYTFLHGDWVHLAVNSVWMLAFGSAVAWRFGSFRFLLFSLICSVAGAAAHLAVHFGQPIPVVGASAAISGQMAAAIRFVFQPGAPLGLFRLGGPIAFKIPALPLRDCLRDGRVIGFLVIWLITNIIFGLGIVSMSGAGQAVAWEAHLGGFLAGLLLFPLFDPIRPARALT
jgi:membrane associated rhomboid family serine protease